MLLNQIAKVGKKDLKSYLWLPGALPQNVFLYYIEGGGKVNLPHYTSAQALSLLYIVNGKTWGKGKKEFNV